MQTNNEKNKSRIGDERPKNSKGEVIIACDFPNKEKTLEFLDQFKKVKPFVKIGMELFYAEGPDIVRDIRARGHKIFLDLKLHDIPNTVGSAMKVLSGLDIDMVNVHAAGGIEMMKAARDGLTGKDGSAPLLIAVTQLTSIAQKQMNEELGIAGSLEDAVAAYASNAKKAGLDGVVCSPLESSMIHERVGSDFLTVTPGIRFASGDKQDQKRVTTPDGARQLGSDFIVVGRSITKADDPAAAYDRAMFEFCR